MGFGGQHSMIPSWEIESIRRMVGSPLKAEPHPYLKCGDRIRLRGGPLQGLEGILIRKRSVWKLLVSVEMLQRSVAVEVDASMVERVSTPKAELATGFLLSNASARG